MKVAKNSTIVKRLEKTREVDPQPDLRSQREERDRNEREGKKKQQRQEMAQQKEDERRRKEEAEMRLVSYILLSFHFGRVVLLGLKTQQILFCSNVPSM